MNDIAQAKALQAIRIAIHPRNTTRKRTTEKSPTRHALYRRGWTTRQPLICSCPGMDFGNNESAMKWKKAMNGRHRASPIKKPGLVGSPSVVPGFVGGCFAACARSASTASFGRGASPVSLPPPSGSSKSSVANLSASTSGDWFSELVTRVYFQATSPLASCRNGDVESTGCFLFALAIEDFNELLRGHKKLPSELIGVKFVEVGGSFVAVVNVSILVIPCEVTPLNQVPEFVGESEQLSLWSLHIGDIDTRLTSGVLDDHAGLSRIETGPIDLGTVSRRHRAQGLESDRTVVTKIGSPNSSTSSPGDLVDHGHRQHLLYRSNHISRPAEVTGSRCPR